MEKDKKTFTHRITMGEEETDSTMYDDLPDISEAAENWKNSPWYEKLLGIILVTLIFGGWLYFVLFGIDGP